MTTAVAKKKQELNDKTLSLQRNISIWLDNYDDIFSDFDPRPFSERALSDDFLMEIQKVSKEQEESVNEIRLLVPSKERNRHDETTIIKRLHTYFLRNHHQSQAQYQLLLKKGIIFTSLGMALIFAASYISSLNSGNLLLHALFVVSESSGWFLVWSGFDVISESSKQNKKDQDFYRKLSKSTISFIENQAEI
jgi:lipopolysaccharide export LptBFGC system permease protein LptF